MIRVAAFSLIGIALIVVATLGFRGCTGRKPPLQPFMDMVSQPRYNAQSESTFFDDGRTQRTPPANVVAWGEAVDQPDGRYAAIEAELFKLKTMPIELDRALLNRGEHLYGVFCTVCHGATGDGKGITTEYGMNRPPSYHGDRLRGLSDGEIFQVITKGKGQMGPYGDRIKPSDRWAIVAYVRALQLSQNAKAEDVPDHIRQRIRKEAGQ